jgi:phenylacetate-coenzyme A ligase PaaK-like adenylate-forming protein
LQKLNDILNISPYSMDKAEKHKFLTTWLSELTKFHYDHCANYKKIIDSIGFDVDNIKSYYDIPFLPVRLFKEYDLLSVDRADIFKTMTSSGTTGSQVSKIYLDKNTASSQTKALTKIVSAFIGGKRLPMIILDTSTVVKDRNLFSARGAGILGFSMFGYEKMYALDENMKLNLDELKAFLEKHKDEDILMFGFTFIIWQHFYNELKSLNEKLDLSRGIIIHGGGWKKLIDQAVDNQRFKQALNSVCNIDRIYNYYGMVEQTGTIYMECEYGHLHTSIFSDVIIRNPIDFKPVNYGEEGIVEVVSLLPKSYPGHALLTEDRGILLGEDDCPCQRKGKYFKIEGRIKNAEIRGCSDTYATKSK